MNQPAKHNQKPDALALKIDLDTKAAQSFAQQSRSSNTKKAYKSDWKHFTEWCAERELESLPATIHTVTLYVASCAEEYKVTTLERRLASISQAHKTSGHESPALVSREPLHSVWSGIVRTKSRLKEKVAPTLTEDIKLMLDHLPRLEDEPGRPLTPQGLRDRAILLLGYAGAMRRSELAGLSAEDLQFTADGLRVLIKKSKTDQEGQGQVIGIIYGSNPATCPVRAVKSWMKAATINTGPLFSRINKHGTVGKKHLTGQSIALIIKRACLRSGLSPEMYSGHSLRAGFTTQAARAGKAERIIMRHTRHKSEKMVREYIREGDLFNESPTDSLGL